MSAGRRGSRSWLDHQEGAVRLAFDDDVDDDDLPVQDQSKESKGKPSLGKDIVVSRETHHRYRAGNTLYDPVILPDSTSQSMSQSEIQTLSDDLDRSSSPVRQEHGQTTGNAPDQVALEDRVRGKDGAEKECVAEQSAGDLTPLPKPLVIRGLPTPERTPGEKAFDMFAGLEDFNKRTSYGWASAEAEAAASIRWSRGCREGDQQSRQ